MKKFRNKGNKHGAVKAFYYLENEGLGKVIELSGSKGSATHYEFEKALVPSDKEEKMCFVKKLSKVGTSLPQYEHTLVQDEILPMGIGMKRKRLIQDMEDGMCTPRRSPRKLD
ncbi:uncharacterized protein [Dysidea avara]|uniref:uncharacterized protein n=1 Tax=Dysidea avara TaxID=196820 RepID=UPI00331F4320